MNSRPPSIDVVDLTTQLGLYALGQLGVERPAGYGDWSQLKLADVTAAPRLDWHRPHAIADISPPGAESAAAVLIVGPGSASLLKATLRAMADAAPATLWVFLMPSAVMEEAEIRYACPKPLAHAEVYRLPDSDPRTFWFILMEQLHKLSTLRGGLLFPPFPELEGSDPMSSNLKESMAAAMTINGALAVALVDYRSGMCLAQSGTVLNLELAAAGNTEVVRAKLKTIESLGLRRGIEDILITLADQFHLIRLVPNTDSLFLYLVLDKEKGNLALARFKLTEIERGLRV